MDEQGTTGGGLPQRSKRYKSRVGAAVLALVVGGFGIHRFYLGQWRGLLYLLLFWTFVPGVIAFIEFIVFLFTSDESWDRKHNEGIARSAGEGNDVAIWVTVGIVLGVVPVIGILAAIAVPAYQDYTQRAQIGEAFLAATSNKMAVAEFAQRAGRYPSSDEIDALSLNIPSGVGFVDSVEVSPNTGIITVTMGRGDGVGARVAGATVTFTPPRLDQPFDAFTWACVSDAPAIYLPRSCRSTAPAY